MKQIMQVISCLENIGILLSETIKNITSQKGEFLNFLIVLMSVVLGPLLI